MRKKLLLLMLCFAFASTLSASVPAQNTTPPDESLLCVMESVGMDDYGQIYYYHIIFYDCTTGVQSSYYDVLSDRFVIYCVTMPPPWGGCPM